ncbi:MAG: hypothetical protein RIQ79_339, partial [Verrucomicrobiota bacterium]
MRVSHNPIRRPEGRIHCNRQVNARYRVSSLTHPQTISVKIPPFVSVRSFVVSAFVSLFVFGPSVRAAGHLPQSMVAKPAVAAPVTITDRPEAWVLDNGIVRATISKRSSHVTSMIYKELELMGPGGIWEQMPSGTVTTAVTIDPKKIGGGGAEVSIKGVNGRMDIEVRYTLVRGSSGLYTYAIYSHPASYPAAGLGESRFINQLNPRFDWLSVDADRNMAMASGGEVGDGVVIHAKEQHILSSGIYKN